MKNEKMKGMNVIKKIICLALVIIMLAGNFANPIASIAAEVRESNSNVAEENDNSESNQNNQGEEEMHTSNVLPLTRQANTNGRSVNSLQPTPKDAITVKTRNDEYEIGAFNTEFVYGAKIDDNNNLVWTPLNSAAGHEFSFRVNYQISGLRELPAESLKFTIPKSILRNRNGDLDDTYLMSLPTSEEFDGTTDLAYIESGDYLVVYNPTEIEAGSNGYFEIAYATKSQTFNYKDYDRTKTDTVPNGGTASDPFYATITLNTGNDTLANLSNDKNVYIDTHAKIVSTEKRYPTIYRSWNTSWMEQTPEDSDQYYYLVWEIKSYIEKDPTQKYNFTLRDVVKDLTEGTTGEDYEIVGYKFAGDRYYSNQNTKSDETRDEYRFDYVLTRHKISTYKEIEYTLKNTVTSVVDPIDQVDPDTKATSQNTFFWDPGFTPPTGHFNLFKYGNNTWYERFGYYWDYANYELDKFQKDEINELKGLRYFTETIGYAYPWTVKEGGSLNEPSDYGYNAVDYETWDDTLYLEGEETPMTSDDYYLDSLAYRITNNDAQYDQFENKFIQTAPTYDENENENIVFYGKINNNWVEIATYNLKNKTYTSNSQYVQNMTTTKITLAQNVNCTGWKATTSNKHYYTYIVVEPTFVLKNSTYVKQKVANKDSIKIQNNVSTNIKDYKGNILFEKETSGIDYARVTYYDSNISKKVSSVSNSVMGKNYRITWKVNAWEKAKSSSEQSEYIRQDSGKFYDLIPAGGEIDVESIQIETENGFIPENEYTYEVKQNYNNSGRIMLIVNIDTQAQYYNVYYNTIHSWDSMKDYGRNVLNPVAYETGNEKIAKGFPDNGGNLSGENKALFTNLDSATDAAKFLYAEQTYDINAVTAAVAGLFKKVKATKDVDYSYSTEVEPNGDYSYQLRYQNTFINKAKDLILFDSLENFKVVDSEAGTTKTSGWRGTLQSINLKQLVLKGINPVVYVSTQEDLNLDEHNDITDTAVWTKLTNETDLAQVKAIAIDMRKSVNGNDFILEPGDSVSAVLHMKSPDEVTGNPYTYNNVYIKDTLIDQLNGTQDYFIHQDYTQVKYHVVADVLIKKVNAEDESEGIKGITFRLYGTSVFNTEVNEFVTSDKNGNIKFEDIEAGTYILQEYEATPDWQEDHTEHTVEINNQRQVKIDGNLVTSLVPLKITNKPRAHTNVTFTKRNFVNNSAIEGAKFKLEGKSNYGNEVLMYSTSNESGKVTFDNIEYGTYELKEIDVPEGYIINKEKYRVIVDENGNCDIGIVTDVVRYLHTANIDDSGNMIGGPFTDADELKSITIPGAKSLHVDLTYAHHVGWFAVYDGTVTPTLENYDQSVSGKLSGYSGYNKSASFDVKGDTVQIFFNRDTSPTGGPYGYYAVITAYDGEFTSIYNNGKYDIYNEPLHSFRVVKKDSYAATPIVGAKFRLTGTSNYGTPYNMEVTSVSAGIVDFTGLESGMYILQEIFAPDVTDDQGNSITYKLDDNSYVVRIEKNGTVTIDGLTKNNNGNFEFYNERNKGQITITKKWMDNSNNDERPEPVVHISTERPSQSNFVYFRNNYNNLNGPLYYIDSTSKTKITGEFKRNTTLTEEEVVALGAKRLDDHYSDPNAEYKIYGWIDNNGNCYWWSNAEKAIMTNNSNKMFYGYNNIQSIDTKDIDTSKVTNMSSMFNGCTNLTNLDVSYWNTSNVTNMSSMFYNCNSLKELDLSSWDTSKVTSMSSMFPKNIEKLNLSGWDLSGLTSTASMFSGCNMLKTIDVSDWNTSTITNMQSMFSGCTSLTGLDVSSWDTSNVTNMFQMFYNCSAITELDLSSWNTGKVTNMSNMFYICNSLKELDLSSWDTSNVTSMTNMFPDNIVKLNLKGWDLSGLTSTASMFSGKSKLEELDVSNWNIGTITNMQYMFSGCTSLTGLDVSSWDTSNVTNMSQMFYNCSAITELDLSSWDTSKVTNMSSIFPNNIEKLNLSGWDLSGLTSIDGLFNGQRKLEELDASNWNIGTITNLSRMFYNCTSLTELDLSGWDTSKVTNMTKIFPDNIVKLNLKGWDLSGLTSTTGLFSGKRKLEELDVSNWNTSTITSMEKTFNTCTSLTGLDVSSWDTSKVTNMSYMFSYCTSLTELDLSSWNTSEVTDMHYMFDGCKSLANINVSNWNTSNVTDMSNVFVGCEKLEYVDVSGWNTDNVTYLQGIFCRCYKLNNIDVSNWNTSNVTNMNSLFGSCKSLESIDVSNWNTEKVTDMGYMFSDVKITELDLSSFVTNNVTKMTGMFYGCGMLTTIYVSENFTTDNVSSSDNMFKRCTSIKGGNGTGYRSSYVNKTYARIDKSGQPGYFTYKAPTTASANVVNNHAFGIIANLSKNNDEVVTISKTENAKPIYMGAPNVVDTNDNNSDESEAISYSTDTYCDENNERVEWVKNGDTWTYTFYVDDPFATWYVWEDDLAGYSSNYTVYYPGKVENQKATIINTKASDDSYEMGDTEPTTGFGKLLITKTLVGKYDDGMRTVTDDNTPFVFHIKLTAKPGYESFINGTKVIGNVIFVDGEGTVGIRPGETVTLDGIPLGTTYKITEDSNPDYKVDGYTDFSAYGASGTINKETKVGATNFKDCTSSSVVPTPEEKFVNLTIGKKVIGNYEVEEKNDIELSVSNLKPNTEYSLSNRTTITSENDGSANITLSLGNEENVIMYNLPVGSKYKVYEHAGDYISSYEITDANDVGSIVNTAGFNTRENKALETNTETADEGEDVTVTITNKKFVTQNLKLQKTVTDANDTNSYLFNIEFANIEEGYSFNSTVGRIRANSNGKAELTVYLAGGEEAEFYNVPVGTTYKITELASGSIASYTVIDENGLNRIERSSNANTVARQSLSTELETVNQGEEVTVTFTNDTVNQEPDSVSSSIGLSKNVIKPDGSIIEDCTEEFTFELTADDESFPMPENNRVTITGNGEATFGTITFDNTGTYTYKIVEKAGNSDIYTYDDTSYTIVYEVTNPEGLLEISKTVKKNGFNGDAIVFTNILSKFPVIFFKTDEDGNAVYGATLQILDNEDNVIKEWIVGKDELNPFALKLATGAYKLHEVSAPSGYELANDVEFVINGDGSVSVNGEVVNVVVMKDPKVQEDVIDDGDDDNKPSEPENNETEEESKEDNKEENKEDIPNAQTGDKIVMCFVILGIALVFMVVSSRKNGKH